MGGRNGRFYLVEKWSTPGAGTPHVHGYPSGPPSQGSGG
jgi:hypothetical protein